MRRQALTALMRRWITVVVWAGAIGLAGCGSTTSSSTSSSGALTVTPTQGGPTTRFSLRFIAPASSGPSGGSRLSFTLGLSGGRASGDCPGPRTVAVPTATKGRPVTIVLNPVSLGGAWCPGPHTARVVEVQGPVCNPGTMCPQYLRVVGTVGETTFTVSSSA
ncbi:MAG: hypothetical protein ACR2GZ_12620 [Solirubrobacteraceae bacterium]